MFKINDNYLKLPGSYLFSTIGKKVSAFTAAHPDKKVIRLGIGDVTQPLAPAVIDSLHKAVEEMAHAETFHGYAPDLGYEFLRSAIKKYDYEARGAHVELDEIFISDGAKGDSGNIQEIFSQDNKIAVCDPVYPVYVDSNVMAGRTGTYDARTETWSDVIYMPCLEENDFVPQLPEETPDLIYLCFPNNPTGSAVTKEQLQVWVDYANKVGAVIIYDAAYEAYISQENIPHTIYECEGARTCAIELRSFSKKAGFTGTRLGFTVVPKDLKCGDVMLNTLWARRHGTKYNGAPYIVQRAGEAVYSPEGKAQRPAVRADPAVELSVSVQMAAFSGVVSHPGQQSSGAGGAHAFRVCHRRYSRARRCGFPQGIFLCGADDSVLRGFLSADLYSHQNYHTVQPAGDLSDAEGCV